MDRAVIGMSRQQALAAGVVRYTPEKTCHRGHSNRYVSNGDCVECGLINKRESKTRLEYGPLSTAVKTDRLRDDLELKRLEHGPA